MFSLTLTSSLWPCLVVVVPHTRRSIHIHPTNTHQHTHTQNTTHLGWSCPLFPSRQPKPLLPTNSTHTPTAMLFTPPPPPPVRDLFKKQNGSTYYVRGTRTHRRNNRRKQNAAIAVTLLRFVRLTTTTTTTEGYFIFVFIHTCGELVKVAHNSKHKCFCILVTQLRSIKVTYRLVFQHRSKQ